MRTTISAEAIGNNIDLLTDILYRLPVKPLVRSKCVSKQWLSLISDPQFCLSYNRHHHTPTPTALLLKNDEDATLKFEIVPLEQDTIPKVPSFDYLNAASDFCIRQSCNGLLLCSPSYFTRIKFGLEHIYYICNPTTKQFKVFSLPRCKSFGSVCMAFDPLKSSHYKLICVRYVRKTKKCHIDMYSSETDSWSPLEITFTPPKRMNISDAVFCNGAVHWYSKDETSLYFDVDTECLNTMPMPNLAEPERDVGYFGESLCHLHLIMTEFPFPLQFDVLELASDYSGWFVRYHVNLDAVRIALADINWLYGRPQNFLVLGVIRAQREEESTVVVFVDKKVISYNVHDKHCDLKLILERGLSHYSWRDTFQYFESLTYV